jgi:hypothetical protein
VSVRLYSLAGSLVATVYDGTMQQGITEVPFTPNRLGRSIYLMKIRSQGKTSVYKLISVAANTYRFSGMSTPAAGRLAKTAAIDWLQAVKPSYATHVEQVSSTSATINITLAAAGAAPNFGANTLIFDPSMVTATMQSQLNTVIAKMESAQFGSDRYALLFKPGRYNLDVHVGFYTEALGLGLSPDDVVIRGAVHVEANWMGNNNATCNFWRSVAGICVEPTSSNNTVRWAVAQATPFRRMHIKGNLEISAGGWASGGYIADSKVDGTLSQWQQQWFSRNSQFGGWTAPGWNFVFVGNTNPPTGKWPNPPYTVIPKTPIVREKPFLFIDNGGNYAVMVPDLKRDSSQGVSWSSGTTVGTPIPIDQFYVARPTDNAASINAALDQGKNLLLTPGIYRLNASIKVTRPGTVVLGIGLPSLLPESSAPAIEAADVDGLKIGGFIVEATTANPANLMVIGETGSSRNHASDPTCLWDIFCRAGGGYSGSTGCMLRVNSNNVIGDHFWLWRADHGAGVGWTSNKNANGLIVNGNNVTMYGLFVEHTQEYQTIWNGNGGRSYFYQCELPYDVPNQTSWQIGTAKGYAGYKVASTVTTHESMALGLYAFFNRAPVVLDNAIEAPANVPGVKFKYMTTISLSGNQGSITHIINGQGGAVTAGATGQARLESYP